MRIGRTLPPAASPFSWRDFLSGLKGCIRPARETDRFVNELKNYFEKRHCYLVSSGKAALAVSFTALKKMNPGKDRVLIPAFTCYSVPSAIVRAGLKVTLCDLAPGTLDFDFKQLTRQVDDKRLLCVVPTHLFGNAADMSRLREVLSDRGIPIIEDAAQAMGAQCNGTKLGTLGDIGIFSLGRGKALNTVEGGILVADDDQMAEAIERELSEIEKVKPSVLARLVITAFALKFLTIPSMFWLPKGLPFLNLGETVFDPGFPIRSMTGFQAGLSRNWESRLSDMNKQRRKNTVEWFAQNKDGMFEAYLPSTPDCDLLRFPIECSDRDLRRHVLEESERRGYGLAPVYPDAISGIKELSRDFENQRFPVASRLSRHLMTLPVHPLMTSRDRHRITELLSTNADQTLPSAGQAGRSI